MAFTNKSDPNALKKLRQQVAKEKQEKAKQTTEKTKNPASNKTNQSSQTSTSDKSGIEKLREKVSANKPDYRIGTPLKMGSTPKPITTTKPTTIETTTDSSAEQEPRDANFWDLTINSAKRGWHNMDYGQESYKQMMGRDNNKDYYEELLKGDDYNFETDNFLEKAISGAAELIGQQAHQYLDPRTITAALGLGAVAAGAGQAGPQVALPEEVVTVPGAILVGAQAGSAINSFEAEAGHAYNELISHGISHDTAMAVANVSGFGSSVLDMIGMDDLVKSFKILKGTGASSSLTKTVLKFILDRLGHVGTEALTEVGQEATVLAGVDAARGIEGKEPIYSWGEVGERLLDTGVSSALSFAAMGGVGDTVNVVSNAPKVFNEINNRRKETGSNTTPNYDYTTDITTDSTVINEPDTLEKAAIDVVMNRNKAEQTADATATTPTASPVEFSYGIDTIPTPDAKTAKMASKTATETSLVERLEELSRNNEPITVEEVKKATAFGDSGSVLITELANTEGVTFSDAKRRVEIAYHAGFTDLDESQAPLTTDIQKLAFRAGKDDRQAQNIIATENAQEATVYDGNVEESEYFKKLPPQAQGMAKTLTKDFGMSTHFVESLIASIVDGETYYANAQHEDGVLKVADNSENDVHKDLIHEALHRMMQVAPEETGLLLNVLYKKATQSGRAAKLGVNINAFDSMKADHDEAGISLNTLGILEEIGAREMQEIFENAEEFNNWRAELDSDANLKKGWAKIVEFINELIEKVKQFVKQIGMTAEEKAKAQEKIEILERYANAYKATMNAVAEKSLQKDGEVKANEGYNGKTSYSKKAKFRPDYDWHTGLTKAQVLKVEEQVNKAGKSEARSITDTAFWYRGRLEGQDLFAIYSMEDPSGATILYLQKGADATEELNILMDLLEDEENGKSAYGKSSFTQRVSQGNWLQNVNGGQHNIRRLGTVANNQNVRVLQGQPQRNGSGAFENVIRDLFGRRESTSESNTSKRGVKTSNSLKAKDTEGKTLTEEQQNYFADSKVRDKDGNLKVMYRGDTNEFTVFDRKKSKASNLYGRGFYFTDSKSHAEQYGKATEYYLDIKNPLSPGQNSITKTQMLNFLKAIENDGEDYDLYNYGEGATAESVLNEVWGKDDFAMLQDINASAVGDFVAALELFNEVNGTSYDGIMLPSETVTFNSEQAKLTSNKKPTKNPDTRFSLKKPVEKTKDLIAVHNLTDAKLRKAFEVGGFPMPSIAVTKANMGHDKFGDITLVFGRDTIDPAVSSGNKLYGGDAYTPTFPSVTYNSDEAKADKLSDLYYDLYKKFGADEARPLYNFADRDNLNDYLNRNGGEAGTVERLKADTKMMQLFFLASGDSKVEPVMTRTEKNMSEAEVEVSEYLIDILGEDFVKGINPPAGTSPFGYRRAYVEKHLDKIVPALRKMYSELYGFTEEGIDNVIDNSRVADYFKFIRNANDYLNNGGVTVVEEEDRTATDKAIRDKAKKLDYDKWVEETFSGIEGKKGIRNEKDPFTPSGKRRGFDELHYEYTLDNIVKAMKAKNDKGISLFGGSIVGASAKNYKSVKQMKADSDRLQNMSQDEYDRIQKEYRDRFRELAMELANGKDSIDAGNLMVEAVAKYNTPSAIKNYIKSESNGFYKYTDEIGNELLNIVNGLANMPTGYFEAKPKRAVGFNEVATAIIPDNASEELKAKLTEINVPYVEYESGNEESRLEALNSLEKLKFSLKGRKSLSSKDTKELLDVIEHLQNEFKRTEFAKADPKKLADMTKKLLREYSSKASYETVLENIDDLYTYIANGEDGHPAVWEDVYNGAMSIANDIVKAAVAVDDSAYREYEGLRKYLRTVPIKFNSAYDSVPSSYENFRDFRRKNYGRLNFTKDGMSIDSMYQELSEMYPEFFNSEEETNSADMLERIVDVLDEIQPTTINPFSREMTDVSTYLANDIISRFFEIPQAKPTFADKAERRVIKAEIAGAKKVEQVRQKRDEKIQKLLADHRAKTKQLIDNAKKAKSEAVSKEKAKREKAVSKMKESQKAKVLRARIMRHASELGKKLLHPSDNQHIPQNLQGAVAALLEHINLESNYTYDATSDSYKKNDEGLPTSRTAAFEVLRRVYSQIAESAVIDPDLMGDDGLLSDVIALGDKRIADMTSEELNTVWQTMRAIEATISTANKLFSASKFEAISEITNALRVDNDGKKVRKELRIGNKVQTLAQLNMLTPETYFHYLGDAGDTIFRMMRDAQDKHIGIMKEVADFTHEVLKGVNINKLEKTLHTVTLGGEKVTLSTAQLMELYVLMKRKQAVEHILLGGILPDNIDKGVLKKNKVEPTRNIKQEEIGKALSELTEKEKAIADKLQNFVSTVLSRHGNEASMQVYNYEKFLEENYWTIRTNKQEIASDVGKDTAVITVANKGMAKGTIPHANTSVRIGSIFDTFSAHSSDMATYAAWLGTTEDINRIRNFVFWEDGSRTGTVKGIIDTVHGSHGTEYLHKLLTDISVGVRGTDTMNPFDKLVGNYKAASVGANIRVIIQQPTAILRALDMIAPQYIGLSGVNPFTGWSKAKKYAPIAQWKDWGHFDINTGRQMKDVLFDNASVLEKLKQAGMWGASMADSISWGVLWNAVEAETKAKHKDLKVDTEEYYNTVSKRFTEIVDHTQVVDGILQRSGIMRSPDSLTKMATSFMGEPTKQYNMAATAIYDAVTKKGEDKRKAVGRLGRTAISLAVAGIVNACVQSIIDALRDDDKEKKYWEKWLASFEGNAIDTVNLFNYVPFAKDIVSIFQGYDVKRMDTETITKTFNAVENMYKTVTGTGKYTIANASANLFAEVARLFGVPVANVKRDVLSVITTMAIQTDNYLMQYRIEKAMLDINYSYNRKNFMDILFNAYNNDREAYELIYKDLLKSGYDVETIQSNMETRMKKAEGVKKAPELSKRYMTPADEKKYDNSLAKIKSSGVWKSANKEQRKNAEADLFEFLTSTAKDVEKLRAEARAFGVDETEYTLWQLAREMSDDGNGSLNAKEKAKAVEMLDFGNSELAYFYGTSTSDAVFAHGLSVENFAKFKGAISELENSEAWKRYSDEQKKKAKFAEANKYADDEKEYLFFIGTEYSSFKKHSDYISYFGK